MRWVRAGLLSNTISPARAENTVAIRSRKKTRPFTLESYGAKIGCASFAMSAHTRCLLRSKNHSRTFWSRNAFPITDTELKLIAAPAITGLRSKPKNG